MTTTTKLILICSLAGACALALSPRSASGVGGRHSIKHPGPTLATNTACALGEIAIWRSALRLERGTPATTTGLCATRWS